MFKLNEQLQSLRDIRGHDFLQQLNFFHSGEIRALLKDSEGQHSLIIPLNKNLEIPPPKKVPLEAGHIGCLQGRDLSGGRQGWKKTFVLCAYIIYF